MIRLSPLVVAAAFGLAACDDPMSNTQLLSDAELNSDIAASAGDAIATSIAGMALNEQQAGVPGASVMSNTAALNSNSLSYTRTQKCYDASNVEVPGCSPIASVRKLVTHVQADGSRSGSHETRRGTTATWTGVVHRIADDTVTRNFNATVEASRTHVGTATGNDTTVITDGDLTRTASEAALDSVKALTWNLPRSSNPWPVSGSVKRIVSANVVVTKGTQTQTRSATRTVTVTFPADAQGNVTLTVNDKTCQLNLVTRQVTNCQ